MPDQSKAAKTLQTVTIAAVLGALIGAAFARPLLKPWFDAHQSGYTFKDWPLLVSFLPWVAFSMYWEMRSQLDPSRRHQGRFTLC